MGTDTLKPGSGNDLALAEDGGSAALTVEQDGDVKIEIGNLIIGTAGKGIDFSQAQTPAAGMTAEVLDSYEEGNFTPSLTFGQNAVGITYNAQIGRYTKIGRIVHIDIVVQLLDKGSSTGHVSLHGLPFTVHNDMTGWETGFCGFTFWSTDGSSVYGLWAVAENDSTRLDVRTMTAAGSTAINLMDTHVGNACYFAGTCVYRATE